jgi:hypothetical protein
MTQEGIERPISLWNDTYIGRVERDLSFSLTAHEPAAQEYFIDLCDRLEASHLVETHRRELTCWPRHFKRWVEEEKSRVSWPIESAEADGQFFYELLGEWLRTEQGIKARYERQIFVHENRLRFMWIGADTTVSDADLAEVKEPVFNQWEMLIQSERALAPIELRQMFQSSPTWPWFTMGPALHQSTYAGVLISFVFCFIILLQATHNIKISCASIFAMTAVWLTNMAVMQLNGWRLGITESIAIVVQIGLSVDYVVHLAEEYSHSRRPTRAEKVQKSFEAISVSMLSGAATTIGSMLSL